MNDKFGVELEFTAAIAHASSKRYGRFYDYALCLMRESGIINWKFDQDNSCGNEFVSPILNGDKGLSEVMQVCHCVKVAQSHFELTRLLGPDCGIHFHYDATDLMKKDGIQSATVIRNVLILSSLLEPLWYTMNPSARFDTCFAAPLNFNLFQMTRARDLIDIRNEWFRPYMGVQGHSDSHRVRNNQYSPEFINNNTKPNKYDWTRYHGLNLVALFKHGTFEFRYAHGSFDEHTIEMWFKFFKSIVKIARKYKTQELLSACGKIHIYRKEIKSMSIYRLQNLMYKDMGRAIRMYFSLAPQDEDMIRFILEKFAKYNSNGMSPKCLRLIYGSKRKEHTFESLMNIVHNFELVATIAYSRHGLRRTAGEIEFALQPDETDEVY